MLEGNGEITISVIFLAPAGASSSSAQTLVHGITAPALTINLQAVLSLPGISATSVAAALSQPSAQLTLAPTSIEGGLEQVRLSISTKDTPEAQTRKYWYVLLLSSGMFLAVLYAIHRYYFRICSSSSSTSFGSTRGSQLLVDRDFVPTDPKRLQV